MRAEGKGELGLASLTASMMGQGSVRLTEAQLSDELQKLGSSVSVSSAQYNNLVTISSLTDKLPQTLALVREVFERPGMREADFERVKAQMLQGMKQSEQQPEWLAGQAFRELVYGKQNRLGQPGDGVLADVEKLTLADVKRFYQNYYNPTNAKVVVVGDVTQAQVEDQLAFLTQWKGPSPLWAASSRRVSRQSRASIWWTSRGAPVGDPYHRRAMPFDTTGDYFTAGLMNFNLGGNFNSRINLNLREDKGYTYGASSGFSANRRRVPSPPVPMCGPMRLRMPSASSSGDGQLPQERPDSGGARLHAQRRLPAGCPLLRDLGPEGGLPAADDHVRPEAGLCAGPEQPDQDGVSVDAQGQCGTLA